MSNDIPSSTELAQRFAQVTPCTCSAQRERAERAEAVLSRVAQLADKWSDPSTAIGTIGLPWAKELCALLDDPDAALRAMKAQTLREAADEHELQLVCCDIYDRLKDKPSIKWTVDERREAERHSICYWGAACAEGDRERADRIEGGY